MGLLPPPPSREFCRHILSCRELKVESFKKCLHSVRWGVSLKEPVTYITLSCQKITLLLLKSKRVIVPESCF